MFEELTEDIGDIAKKTAVWLTGKGFSMGLVAAAVHGFGQSASLIPIISLPIAAGVASLNANTSHGQREKKILNAYRKEIGAFLDIEPTRVSIEHLHMVANGNDKLGIPSNHIIKEAIEKNDTTRGGKIFSHLSAMGVSLGIMLSVISGGVFPAATGAVVAATGVGVDAAALITVVGLSAITSFVTDQAVSFLTKDFLGINKATANDRIKEMGQEIADGKEISKERIFSLFVEANPDVADKILGSYSAKYNVLPRAAQRMVIQHYDEQFHISAVTELINSQRMDITELAFAAQGIASGVQARPAQHHEDEQEVEKKSPVKAIFEKAVNRKVTVAHPAAVADNPNAIDISDTKVAMDEQPATFAERFEKKRNNASYAEAVKKKAIADIRKGDSHDAKTALGEELLSDAGDIAQAVLGI